MREADLMAAVELSLSQSGFCVFRANVGTVRMADGRFFKTGLPKGFSDLFAIKDGRIYFIETKVHPNKPTMEQNHFLYIMRTMYGCEGGVAYTVEEARKICGL